MRTPTFNRTRPPQLPTNSAYLGGARVGPLHSRVAGRRSPITPAGKVAANQDGAVSRYNAKLSVYGILREIKFLLQRWRFAGGRKVSEHRAFY